MKRSKSEPPVRGSTSNTTHSGTPGVVSKVVLFGDAELTHLNLAGGQCRNWEEEEGRGRG